MGLGLCTQIELDAVVRKAAAKAAKERPLEEAGATLAPVDELGQTAEQSDADAFNADAFDADAFTAPSEEASARKSDDEELDADAIFSNLGGDTQPQEDENADN